MQKYTKAITVQEDINTQIKALDEKFKGKLEAIESEKDAEKKETLTQETQKELIMAQQQLQQYGAMQTQQLMNEVLKVAQSIAKKIGVDVILEKQTVYYGGTPMTDLVISELNK